MSKKEISIEKRKEREGLITNIQRMSIQDGPGIRSTVFMKGCNFRCLWCHNPETFSTEPEIEWIRDKCIGCRSCVNICKTGAFSLKDGSPYFRKEMCNSCFDCVSVCYTEAINKIGRNVSPEEIFEEVKQDFPFFKSSGGGITISGGEPMLQVDFVEKTLSLFHQAKIHTALDTNLSLPWSLYERVLPFTDLVLADLKLIEDSLHVKYTGQHNRTVLENFRKLEKTGVPFWVRTPVVPGVNNNENEIRTMASFVSSLKNVKKYELLGYHTLGSCKYINLQINDPMAGSNPLPKNDLLHFQEILKEYNF